MNERSLSRLRVARRGGVLSIGYLWPGIRGPEEALPGQPAAGHKHRMVRGQNGNPLFRCKGEDFRCRAFAPDENDGAYVRHFCGPDGLGVRESGEQEPPRMGEGQNIAHEIRGFDNLNVEIQLGDPDSLLTHYQSLIALRHAHPALSRGGFYPVQSADNVVFAFLRDAPDGQVLVVVNFDDESTMDYALGLSESPLPPGLYAATDLLTGEEGGPLTVESVGGFEDYQPFPELAARSALLLHLEPGRE